MQLLAFFVLFFFNHCYLAQAHSVGAADSEDEGIEYIYPDDEEPELYEQTQDVTIVGNVISILLPVTIAIMKGHNSISHSAILHGLDAAWRYTALIGSLNYVQQPEYTYSPTDRAYPEFFEKVSDFCQTVMGSQLYFWEDYQKPENEIYSFVNTWSIIFGITSILSVCPWISSPNWWPFILFRLLFYPSLIVMFGVICAYNTSSTLACALALLIFIFVLLLPVADYVFDFGLLDHFALGHEVDDFQYIFIYLLRDIGIAAALLFGSSNQDQLLMMGVLEGCFALAAILYEPYTHTDLNLYYSSVLSYILTTVYFFASIDKTGALIASIFFLCTLGSWVLFAFVQIATYALGYTNIEGLEDIGLSNMSLRKLAEAGMFDSREYYRLKREKRRSRRGPEHSRSEKKRPLMEDVKRDPTNNL